MTGPLLFLYLLKRVLQLYNPGSGLALQSHAASPAAPSPHGLAAPRGSTHQEGRQQRDQGGAGAPAGQSSSWPPAKEPGPGGGLAPGLLGPTLVELCLNSGTWAGETPEGQEERCWHPLLILLLAASKLRCCWSPAVPLLPRGPVRGRENWLRRRGDARLLPLGNFMNTDKPRPGNVKLLTRATPPSLGACRRAGAAPSLAPGETKAQHRPPQV